MMSHLKETWLRLRWPGKDQGCHNCMHNSDPAMTVCDNSGEYYVEADDQYYCSGWQWVVDPEFSDKLLYSSNQDDERTEDDR